MKLFREVTPETSSYGGRKFFIKKTIPDFEDPSKPYLTRYILFRTKNIGVFLHKIWIADNDRHLHDHPWRSFTAFILKGGYTERYNTNPAHQKYERMRHHGFLSRNKIDNTTAHSITALDRDKPVWTIVFPRKNVSTWGFWVPDPLFDNRNLWVDWKDYIPYRQPSEVGTSEISSSDRARGQG